MARQYEFNSEKRSRNFSDFYLYAEGNAEKTSYYRYNEENGSGVVYGIEIGCDLYIGSTVNIYSRARNHIEALFNHKHDIKIMQDAYDNVGEARLYILMQASDHLHEAETLVMRLLQPTLNATIPTKKDGDDIVWQMKWPKPVIQAHQTPCPWCGYPINVIVKKGDLITVDQHRKREETLKRRRDAQNKSSAPVAEKKSPSK